MTKAKSKTPPRQRSTSTPTFQTPSRPVYQRGDLLAIGECRLIPVVAERASEAIEALDKMTSLASEISNNSLDTLIASSSTRDHADLVRKIADVAADDKEDEVSRMSAGKWLEQNATYESRCRSIATSLGIVEVLIHSLDHGGGERPGE